MVEELLEKQGDSFKGLKVSATYEAVTQLQFVDMLAIKYSLGERRCIKEILRHFEIVSGQVISRKNSKSSKLDSKIASPII